MDTRDAGRRGGQSKSEAKSKAARKNAAKARRALAQKRSAVQECDNSPETVDKAVSKRL